MTNDQRIAEIEARCELATPGPWDDKLTAVYKDETAIRICGEFYNFDADAFFVAQARQDIPYLLAQLAERGSGCEHCRGWDSRCGANYCPMCGKRLEVEHI